MHIYNHIALNSSQHEKYFRQSCRKIQNTHLCLVFFFKSGFLYDYVGKYGTARQAAGDNAVRRRRDATCMPGK